MHSSNIIFFRSITTSFLRGKFSQMSSFTLGVAKGSVSFLLTKHHPFLLPLFEPKPWHPVRPPAAPYYHQGISPTGPYLWWSDQSKTVLKKLTFLLKIDCKHGSPRIARMEYFLLIFTQGTKRTVESYQLTYHYIDLIYEFKNDLQMQIESKLNNIEDSNDRNYNDYQIDKLWKSV